ncbi:MAG: hypothetical protein ACPGXK_15800 [Phycisphaerae bacterium]
MSAHIKNVAAKAGAAGFMFFAIKGCVWLVIFALAWVKATN